MFSKKVIKGVLLKNKNKNKGDTCQDHSHSYYPMAHAFWTGDFPVMFNGRGSKLDNLSVKFEHYFGPIQILM